MYDLRKAAEGAFATLAIFSVGERPSASTVNNLIADLLAALAQPERKPLTEDEIELAYREIWRDLSDGFRHTSAEWIEAGIRYAEKVHGIE